MCGRHLLRFGSRSLIIMLWWVFSLRRPFPFPSSSFTFLSLLCPLLLSIITRGKLLLLKSKALTALLRYLLLSSLSSLFSHSLHSLFSQDIYWLRPEVVKRGKYAIPCSERDSDRMRKERERDDEEDERKEEEERNTRYKCPSTTTSKTFTFPGLFFFSHTHTPYTGPPFKSCTKDYVQVKHLSQRS